MNETEVLMKKQTKAANEQNQSSQLYCFECKHYTQGVDLTIGVCSKLNKQVKPLNYCKLWEK